MKSISTFSVMVILALTCLIGCSEHKKPVETQPVQVVAPAPPPAAGPEIAVEIVSTPEKALVTYREKEYGETPVTMTLPDFGDVTLITARQENREFVEKRIRILAPDRVQVIFRFDGEPSAMLKALGLARALIFDYSDRTAFDLDKAELKPEALPILTRQAEILNRYFADIPVNVCGHTDSTGTADHNLKLSLQRAEAVAACLETHQVPRSRMRIQGFGPDYPLDSNSTPAGRALNRRTELVLPQ